MSRCKLALRLTTLALIAAGCGSDQVTGISDVDRAAFAKGKPGGGGTPADPVIAYTTARTQDLVVANEDGSAAATLTNIDVFGSVAWSPTLPQIAFGGEDRNGFGLFIADVAVSSSGASFGHVRRLLDGNQWGQPEWSPDGTRLSYRAVVPGESVNGVYVVPATGGTPVLLRALSSGEHSTTIFWSPDGGRIGMIVHESANYEDTRLDLIDPGSGELLATRRLPQNARFGEWARDGHIWFSGFPDAASSEQIMRLDPDSGGDPQIMFAGTAPTVSPGGDKVAYEDDRGALLVRDLTTAAAVRIAKIGHAPDWR